MGYFVGIVLSLLAVSPFVRAEVDTKADQKIAFQSLLAEIKTHYGMAKYKKAALGVDIDQLEKKYLALIDSGTSLEVATGLWVTTADFNPDRTLSADEFRQLMVGFGAEFKDGHTNITRNSSELYTLGIQTAAIGGRLYITGFSAKFYETGRATKELQIGDEILEVDGRSVSEIARENLLYAQRATFATRQQFALESILNVPGRFLRAKKAGETVELKLNRDGVGQITGRYNWSNVQDYLTLAEMYLGTNPPKLPVAAPKRPYIYGERSNLSYFWEGLTNLKLKPGMVTDIGKLMNVDLPEKALPIRIPGTDPLDPVKKVSRLQAYTVKHGGKTLGVIRIPNYTPDSPNDIENELLWLGKAIAQFENSTDGLIIDQLSNGGGYVHAVVEYLRLFANKGALKSQTIDQKISQTYLDMMAPSNQVPTEQMSFSTIWLNKLYKDLLTEKYKSGDRWTGTLPFMSTTEELTSGETGRIFAENNPVYSKPIMLLNDSRSASGGDFFPSILQANDRALIYGETSMGLGGPVYRTQSSMPGSEMSMRCTFGMCYPSTKLQIENIGVVPNVYRPVTPTDLKLGFKAYAKDALDAMVLYLNGKSAGEIEKFVTKPDLTPDSAAVRSSKAILETLVDELSVIGNQEFDRILALYQKRIGEVVALMERSSAEEWQRLTVPLPEALRSDLILSSLRRADEVIDRLQEMLTIPSNQGEQNAALRGFIQAMAIELSKMGNFRVPGPTCDDLLRKAQKQY